MPEYADQRFSGVVHAHGAALLRDGSCSAARTAGLLASLPAAFWAVAPGLLPRFLGRPPVVRNLEVCGARPRPLSAGTGC